MANENHTFRFTSLGKHDFAGQGDQIDIAIDTGVGADDLDDFVLVAVFEQFLNDSSSGHAAGLRIDRRNCLLWLRYTPRWGFHPADNSSKADLR